MRGATQLNSKTTAELKEKLSFETGSALAGTGIMLLNSQIKKRLPDLSIDDRSKMVTEIWSNMSDEETRNLTLHGSRGWICDPHRKEFSIIDTSIDSYSKNILHRTMLHTTIPFLQLVSGGVVRAALLDRPPKSDEQRMYAAHEAVHIMREVLSDEVAKVSTDIPAKYLTSKSDAVNSGRIKKIVERMHRRRKRLRHFAANRSRNSDISNKGNIEKYVRVIKDLAFPRK